MSLSPHFELSELIYTSHNIDNTPSLEVIASLQELCTTLLEPIRAQFGPLHVSSGYRCVALNMAIGGAPESAHVFGCAADFMPMNSTISREDVLNWVMQSTLPFDQIIDEGTGTSAWVHIALVRPGFETTPRKEALLYRNGKYSPFV